MIALTRILRHWKWLLIGLLVSTTVSAAYVAKHQYDAKKNLEHRVQVLKANLKQVQEDKDLADNLLVEKNKIEKKLREELNKKVKVIIEEPDDGCLDTAAPAAVLDSLR